MSSQVRTLPAIRVRELLAAAIGQPRAGIYIPDRDYAVPVYGWILRDYATFFSQQLRAWGLSYAAAFDCDNFAALYKTLAHVCYARRKARSAPQSLAVGELHYWQGDDPMKGHAINVAIVGADQAVVFIEPQSQSLTKLSAADIRGVQRVMF